MTKDHPSGEQRVVPLQLIVHKFEFFFWGGDSLRSLPASGFESNVPRTHGRGIREQWTNARAYLDVTTRFL